MICCIPTLQPKGGESLEVRRISRFRVGSCCRSSSWNYPLVVDRLTIKNYWIPQTVYSPVWGFLFYNKKVAPPTLLLIKPLKGESLGLISRYLIIAYRSFARIISHQHSGKKFQLTIRNLWDAHLYFIN